jgi:hypothetical protein
MIFFRTTTAYLFILLLISCGVQKNETAFTVDKTTWVDSLPGQCPYLAKDTKGNTVLSWVRVINDSSAVFCYAVSTNGGLSFGSPITIPGSSNIEPHSENLPKIIFKPSGEIIALWGAGNPNPKNKYAGLVSYAQSFDEGNSWTAPQTLVKDTAGYDQRYYDVNLLPNGEVGIIWLDNRKTTTSEGSALYFASTEGRDGFKNERMIGQPCCQCCRTRLFIDSKNNIHVLYRGILKDSVRDLVHAVSLDNGQSFSSPKLVSNDNWVIRGCPHTGPAMTENKEGLHFTWFTGASDKGCFYTNSTDNGMNFNSRQSISRSGSHPQIASLPGEKLVIVWDEPVKMHDKFYRRIGIWQKNANGSDEKGFITADTSMCSYPVVYNTEGNMAVVAYTQIKGEKNYIGYQLLRR